MNYLTRFTLLCLAPALLVFGGFAEATAQTTTNNMKFDSLQAVKEIADENKTFTDALSKSDSVAVSNVYTEDAKILNNGSPSTLGRAEVMHFYGGTSIITLNE